MKPNSFRIVEARVEERPHYFDFVKNDITGHHPSMANLTYDPFPDAKGGDVVRTEIIGRKLVLHAKIEGPFDAIKMGAALNYEGHKFALEKITEHIDTESDQCLFEVEGFAFTSLNEPIQVLKLLRESLAAGISR